MTGYGQRALWVKAGDAQSLLDVIKEANKLNAKPDAKRLYVLIPDGRYDLGKRVLTRISGHNIAFVGQSMQGTVITNKPDAKNEGISKTAVLQNRGTNNYFQDMTLHNALDYYACGAAGRAVTLHDKGTRTICNRVRLLSYQDTYYSDREDAGNYFCDSEIHGTVDFICGAGDVWFDRCRIVTEKRTVGGEGRNVIVAPRTSETPWGFIFANCTVENVVSDFLYARGWHTSPHNIWLHTTLLTPERLLKERFDPHGMRTVMSDFKEYGTRDAMGRDITPMSNVVTYTLTEKKKEGDQEVEVTHSRSDETILTAEQADRYTLDNVFGKWHPDRVARKLERKAAKLFKKQRK